MKKIAVALLLGALTIPATFAADKKPAAPDTQSESKSKKKSSKKKSQGKKTDETKN